MQLSTLSADHWEARKKYAEYLSAVKQRHSTEYVALKNAYREIIRGRQVIDLVQTMRTGGLDLQARPRLAIIRADAKLCYYDWAEADPSFAPEPRSRLRPNSRSIMRLPSDTFPPVQWATRNTMRLRAVVPSIPPSLLPAGKLDKYHILWEAEWETLPVDPVLLRHLGRNLYAVLAQWDLTPLERAVLQPMPSN